MGVANRRSIAWGIAQSCHAAGAEVALSYAGERLAKDAGALAEQLGRVPTFECDVTSDQAVATCFAAVEELWPEGFDFLVHAIAFADKADLEAPFHQTSRAGYQLAQDVSAYSLTAVTKAALPSLKRRGGGSVLTLSYLGAQRAIPGYNVMGVAKAALEASVRYLAMDLGADNVRVNAVSAGPLRTLAARGIRNFSSMLKHHEEAAPLGRNVTVEEVAATSTFLVSPGASGITGQVVFVDAGYSIR